MVTELPRRLHARLRRILDAGDRGEGCVWQPGTDDELHDLGLIRRIEDWPARSIAAAPEQEAGR